MDDNDRRTANLALEVLESRFRKRVSEAMLSYATDLLHSRLMRAAVNAGAVPTNRDVELPSSEALRKAVTELETLTAFKNSDDISTILDSVASRLKLATHGDHKCEEDPESTNIKIRGFGDG